MIKYYYINDGLGEVELNAESLQEASIEIYNRYRSFGEATVEAREYTLKNVSVFTVKENS